VAAIEGSTGKTYIENYNETNPKITPRLYTTNTDAIKALENGEVDAFINDSGILLNLAKQSKVDLITVGGLLSNEPYGLGLPKDDHHFIDLVNCTLQELKADGTYDQIFDKWFGENEGIYASGQEPAIYPIEVFPGERNCDFDATTMTLEQPSESKVDKIHKEIELKVGVFSDHLPFSYETSNSEWDGFNVKIAKELVGRWFRVGEGNQLTEKIAFVEVSTEEQGIQLLQEGEIDLLIAPVTHRTERDQDIDFSQTYFAKTNPAGDGFSQGPYRIGVPQFDSRFRNLVNLTLQEMKRDGTYDALYCRYFVGDYTPYSIELWPVERERTRYDEINIKRVGTPLENSCRQSPGELGDFETYTVAPGDTLFKIAENKYGNGSLWEEKIYNVELNNVKKNYEIIGSDPNNIEPGMVLYLPKA
jgi:ABC-type amino acid transport substrate-binding protein